MPIYDTALLDLLKAGASRATFHAAADSLWPEGTLDLLGSFWEYVSNLSKATSGSSVTIGAGTKTFTLDSARGWPAGLPVYITENGAPTTKFMTGKLLSAESGGVISVSVDASSGSGTYTGWTISALLAQRVTATPPVGIADGGTGGTTPAAALAALGAARLVQVAAVSDDDSVAEVFVAADPGAPRVLVAPSASGAFSGMDDAVATYVSPGNWTFETLSQGAVVWDRNLRRAYFYTASEPGHPSPTGLVVERLGALAPNAAASTESVGGTTSLSFDAANPRRYIEITAAGTYTLPTGGNGGEWLFRYVAGSGTATINVASSGTIDGVASVTLNTTTRVARLTAFGSGKYLSF